jgi:hypothetical protein
MDMDQRAQTAANTIIQHLHNLVTYGPWDLDIALAMSRHGYDEVKWAEGQGVLAELVSSEPPTTDAVSTATAWYDEAANAARQALAAQPCLLAKLGLA